jgi:hypothetical protein
VAEGAEEETLVAVLDITEEGKKIFKKVISK